MRYRVALLLINVTVSQAQIYIPNHGNLGLGIENDIVFEQRFSNSIGLNLMYTPDMNRKRVRNIFILSTGYKVNRFDERNKGIYYNLGYQYYFGPSPKTLFGCVGTNINFYGFDLTDKKELGFRIGIVFFSTLSFYYQCGFVKDQLVNGKYQKNGVGINLTLNSCSLAHFKII